MAISDLLKLTFEELARRKTALAVAKLADEAAQWNAPSYPAGKILF